MTLSLGERFKPDFPMLQQLVHGKPYTYLDTAATAQKPQLVIDRMERFYATEYATVRRGVYAPCQVATQMYEAARERCRAFVNGSSVTEIIFVRGSTEGLNLIASSLGRLALKPGDEVVVTEMEHHANIVPWHMVCQLTGATLKAIPITDAGELQLEALATVITDRTRIVSLTHVSNVLGTHNPVELVAKRAREVGAYVVVDGAQSSPHLDIDVQALDCDFFVCSSHKLYGPSGAGFVWGREEILRKMPPYQGGGEMIDHVSFDRVTYDEPPYRFEAGTPPIAPVIGMHAALDYLDAIGKPAIAAWEDHLLRLATAELEQIPGLRIFGNAAHKSAVIAFVMEGVAPMDIGMVLDREGIAVRVGQHCAQPLLRRLGVHATARASFGLYNTEEDVARFVEAVREAKELLA